MTTRKPDTTGAELHNGKWIVDVTDRARRIFGDIVLTAHQEVSEYGGKFTENSAYHTQKIRSGEPDAINLRYGDVIIIFANGNRVSIYSSEWGAIEKAGE